MQHRSPFKFSYHQFLALCLSGLMLCLVLEHQTIAQPLHPHQLVQQGVEQYQQGHYTQAIQNWQIALSAYQNPKNRDRQATILENLARAYQQTGQLEQALQHWNQAIALQRQLNHLSQVGRLLTEQAQTHSRMGQHRQAITLLCNPSSENTCQPSSALQLAQTYKDPKGEVAALGSLGETYRLVGEHEKAIQYLKQATQLQQPIYQINLLNSLGNAYLAQAQRWDSRVNSARVRGAEDTAQKFQSKATANYQQALKQYKSSLQLARKKNDASAQLQPLLNLLRLESSSLVPENEPSNLQQEFQHLLQILPNSSTKIYAAIHFANLFSSSQNLSLSPTDCPTASRLDSHQTQAALTQAIQNSQKLQDGRAESFALGALGHFYECQQQFPQALDYTRKALWVSDQQKNAQDSLYLWEWQTGRILDAQGNRTGAITAYERAYQTLEQTRGDILNAKRDLQFDFRDNVEPLYRQLAQLKLELASQQEQEAPKQNQALTRALKTIDALKIAELQNYFGFDCQFPTLATDLDQNQRDFDPFNQISADTAVFVSVILPQRTAIVANIPTPKGRSQHLHWINRDRPTLTQTIRLFREQLQQESNFKEVFTKSYLTSGKDLYNEIINPFSSQLKASKVNTLVFIQDGLFRNIPMAALYDGKKYLVEEYAIATTPSLELTQAPLTRSKRLPAISLGLTEKAIIDGETFPALPAVKSEIAGIAAQFPNSQQFLDAQFSRSNLQQAFRRNYYPVVHIATHGKFGTIPDDSFLVAGNGQKIMLSDLEQDLRTLSPRDRAIELLILSACQTAIGDDRTTLGMAGLTVQAGVKSALASLWLINDAATQALVTQFVNNWQDGIGKAEALKRAQKTLIDEGYHPAKWAPFVLIGNWQ